MFYFCASYLVILLSFYCLVRPEGKDAKGALLGQVVLDFPSNLDFPIWTRIWIFQVHASKLIQCHTNLVKPAILFFLSKSEFMQFSFLGGVPRGCTAGPNKEVFSLESNRPHTDGCSTMVGLVTGGVRKSIRC